MQDNSPDEHNNDCNECLTGNNVAKRAGTAVCQVCRTIARIKAQSHACCNSRFPVVMFNGIAG